ncbi:MAG: class I SAM-dependent methyltransferase [Candidatus Micrarchaeota archaeon]
MRLKGVAGALSKPHVYAWEKEYRTGRGRWRGTTNFELKLPKKSRVLEVGCGNGKHLSALIDKGFEVYAIDVSPSAVKLAKELAEFHKAAATIAVGDACSMDFRNDFFDAVFLFHVIGHLSETERRAAVAEAFRVLRKGGRCYFRGFAEGDLRYGKGKEVEKATFRRGTNVWVHYFSAGEARDLFGAAGFVTEELGTEKWHVWFRGKPYERREIRGIFKKA